MFRTLTATAALTLALASGAFAETVEVEMLNRGEGRETMVFRPDFVRIAPGDTVKFVPTDRGHNVQSDPEMWPEGVEPFEGKINEEVDVTFDTEGLYGAKCLPHYAMGMVMTIAVGDVAEAPEGWLDGRLPRKAKERYENQLTQLAQ